MTLNQESDMIPLHHTVVECALITIPRVPFIPGEGREEGGRGYEGVAHTVTESESKDN